MRYFLNQFDYVDKDDSVVFDPDALIVRRGREAVGDWTGTDTGQSSTL